MVFQWVLPVLLLLEVWVVMVKGAATTTASSNSSIIATTLPGCPATCGNVVIPYPFGIGGVNCSRQGLNLTCRQDFTPPKLFLGNGSIEVTNISLTDGNVLTNIGIVVSAPAMGNSVSWAGLEDGPYTLSPMHNMFTAIGCGTLASLQLRNVSSIEYLSICAALCKSKERITNGLCSGNGCCQSSIPDGIKSYSLELNNLNQQIQQDYMVKDLSYKAFVVDKDWFRFSTAYLSNDQMNESTMVPVVLDWVIDDAISCEAAMRNTSSYACVGQNSECRNSNIYGNGYLCKCSQGYQGNPYLTNATGGDCEDINECTLPELYPCYGECFNTRGNYICICPQGTRGDGRKICFPDRKGSFVFLGVIIGVAIGLSILLLLGSGALVHRRWRQRNVKKLKARHFHQNRGLLLQQLISSNEDVTDRTKIFTLEELEKATNKFDESRIIGRGGHGTVYKGILSDQRIVAIKKSKIIEQSEIDQFINEVAILSQIKHRNIVRLFGCCLETQVPLLVYEFISYGTLSDHLHAWERSSSMSWEDRLRIATEIAGSLAYLHSAASISIYHRDVKSSNILLDDSFTVKVSDFGASRSISTDQTHLTTVVQGTFGYLDPEYAYTQQLTQKSDVYSFGVILVELLTGEKPVSLTRSEENRSLPIYFLRLLRENNLFQLVESRIMEEGARAEIEEVATLAEICLRIRGEERPTMKEVESRLEGLRRLKKQQPHPWTTQNLEESEGLVSQLHI